MKEEELRVRAEMKKLVWSEQEETYIPWERGTEYGPLPLRVFADGDLIAEISNSQGFREVWDEMKIITDKVWKILDERVEQKMKDSPKDEDFQKAKKFLEERKLGESVKFEIRENGCIFASWPKDEDFQDPNEDEITLGSYLDSKGIKMVRRDLENEQFAPELVIHADEGDLEFYHFHEDERIRDLENDSKSTGNDIKPTDPKELKSRDWKFWD